MDDFVCYAIVFRIAIISLMNILQAIVFNLSDMINTLINYVVLVVSYFSTRILTKNGALTVKLEYDKASQIK